MNEISITDEAIAFIQKFHQENFPKDELIILFADPNALGGVIIIELYRRNFIMDHLNHFQELELNHEDCQFSVFIDRQIIQEGTFPDRIEIFIRNNLKDKPVLDYKNLDFEQ